MTINRDELFGEVEVADDIQVSGECRVDGRVPMKEKIRQLLKQWEKDYHDHDRKAALAGSSSWFEEEERQHLKMKMLLKYGNQLKQLLEE